MLAMNKSVLPVVILLYNEDFEIEKLADQVFYGIELKIIACWLLQTKLLWEGPAENLIILKKKKREELFPLHCIGRSNILVI